MGVGLLYRRGRGRPVNIEYNVRPTDRYANKRHKRLLVACRVTPVNSRQRITRAISSRLN